MDRKMLRRKLCGLFTPIKYALLILLSALVCIGGRTPELLPGQLAEIALTFALSEAVLARSVRWGRIVSDVLSVLIAAQLLVLKFGSTYLSMIMLTNLDSFNDLSGSMGVYISWVVPSIAAALLPVGRVFSRRSAALAALAVTVAAEVLLIPGGMVTPGSAYVSLAGRWADHRRITAAIAAGKADHAAFFREGIAGGTDKPEGLSDRPNVVIVFTEGLSQHIVDDERDIMANVRDWQGRSLTFANYYNHTFATYRALIGQLYSGFQLNNEDPNCLISLHDILRGRGYDTIFLNTEPNDAYVTGYINALGFSEVRYDPKTECKGINNSLSDRQAYEAVRAALEEQAEKDAPCLICIYTYGTHLAQDSVGARFGDGSDPELNKFYDLDLAFGDFMVWFSEAECTKDTLLVFTADHAAYADSYYKATFPDAGRADDELDTVPLFFYYNRVAPQVIDVGGRNSIDLAPTVLDLLDVSAPNYFLGGSLFLPRDTGGLSPDTLFHGADGLLCSDGGAIRSLTASEKEQAEALLIRYFTARLEPPEES